MGTQVSTASIQSNIASVISGSLFIAGSAIGIGILSLPAPLGMLGLIPSLFVFIFSFLVMLASAFILIEIYNSEGTDINLFSLSKKFLGPSAASLLKVIYTLLFVSLIFAYLNKGGSVLMSTINNGSYTEASAFMASIFLAFIGIASILTNKDILDRSNRLAVVIMFIAYGFLIFFSIPQKGGDLAYKNMGYLMTSIPFVIVTFGYHNMIPSIKKRYDLQGQNLKMICIVGSLLTFAVYFIWVAKVLMTLPVGGPGGIAEIYASQKLTTESLLQLVSSPYFFYGIQIFSFLAILTSLVGQGISLTDFLLDSFRKKGSVSEKLVISSSVSVFALIFIYFYPNLFYTILEVCGGIFAAIIFCIYPSLIFLKARGSSNKRHFFMALFVLASGCSLAIYEILKQLPLF